MTFRETKRKPLANSRIGRTSPNQLQAVSRSGSLVRIYRDRPLRWRDLWFTFLPASAAVLTPLLYGFQRARYANAFYGPAAAAAWSRPWYQLSAAGLIPLLLLGLLRLRRSNRMVKIYKNGIVIQGMGLKTHRFTWGEISGISCQESKHHFWGMLLKDKIQPVLHPSTGKPVILYSRLPNLRELCARIKAKIYPRMLLKMRTAMRSGSTVYFGPIFFNNQSIHIRKKGYRWNQVTAIDVQNGILRITLKEQPDRRIPIAKIPNIELFIQLVQEGLIE